MDLILLSEIMRHGKLLLGNYWELWYEGLYTFLMILTLIIFGLCDYATENSLGISFLFLTSFSSIKFLLCKFKIMKLK